MLSDELAEKFGLEPVGNIVPPHLTLKVPFETDLNIDELEMTLKDFAGNISPAEIILKGFGSFGTQVIFIDALPSPEALVLLEKFNSQFQSLSDISLQPFDLKRKLHATLAYPPNQKIFSDMVGYLSKFDPEYNISLDNICIMKRNGRRWEPAKEYVLK